MRTRQFQQVRFEKIYISDFDHPMDPAAWPKRHRWIIDDFHGDEVDTLSREELDRKFRTGWGDMTSNGPPRFYVAANRKLVFFGNGREGWEKFPQWIAELIQP